MVNTSTGITTSLTSKGTVAKCGTESSEAPRFFEHQDDPASEFAVYDQAGNREVYLTAPPETRDPGLTPPASQRRAVQRSR
jgi:hypothetical protein